MCGGGGYVHHCVCVCIYIPNFIRVCTQLMGVDPGEDRWKRVIDTYLSLLGTPIVTWQVTETDRQTDRQTLFVYLRFSCHLMMALSHGKLCESTAQLALARQMLKVSHVLLAFSSVTSSCLSPSSLWRNMLRVGCPLTVIYLPE